MMQNDILWVIIPVYNVEKVLSKCIRSIQKQTYTNWKMVLVDDGSTDRSGAICDKFAKSDERIVVIHSVNGGPHVARMRGLECISDDSYCCFCDSDDELPPNALELLYEEAQRTDADLVCGNMQRIVRGICLSSTASLSCFSDPRTYTHEEIVRDIYLCCFGGVGNFPVSMCGKLYKTEIIRPIMLNLDCHPRCFAEDLNVMMRVLPEVKKLSVIDAPVYRYRVGGGTSRFMPTFLDDNILMYRLKKQWSEKCTSTCNLNQLIAAELKNIVVSYWIMCEKNGRYPHGNLVEEVKAVCAMPEVREAITLLGDDRSGLSGINPLLQASDYDGICERIRQKVKKDRPKGILKRILMG